ncbi:MAG: ATP-binding protein [Patescibacteria group bacterium]
MAENQTKSDLGLVNPLVVPKKPKVVVSPSPVQPPAVEPEKVFEPLPAEPVAPKTPSPAQPKVEPLPQNSAQIAMAAGLTSAQIEKQSPQKTFPTTAPVAPQIPTPAPTPAPVATPVAPNVLAKLFDKLVPKPPVPAPAPVENPNAQKKLDDKNVPDQFVNHNQIALGGFINNFFGKAQKTNDSNPEQELSKKVAGAEKIYQEGLASVRDLISPSSFEIHYDHLNLSGVYVRSFFVYAYPRFLETNWMSPIINFDATVDVSQFIYPIASEEIMRTLKRKVAQIESSITMSAEKGNVRDPQLETALEDAEQLRTDLQRGQEKFFQFGMYFTVYAEDLKKLEATTKIIESQLGGKLILTKRADIQGEHAFNSTLPLCVDELEVQRNMNTSPLSTTFPFISSSLATDEGILYGLNRHNNSLIIFDRFKLPNANSTVFATSGAGKSYAVKLEILRQVMLGTDVIVVDPENEYKALTETVGGSYLNMSLNSDQRINPFDLPAPFEGDNLKPGDLLRENIITLTGLLKLMLGEMTASEAALIDKALIDTYAVRGITMSVEDPSKMPMPTMEDLHSVLKSMAGAESLAQRLQKFTTGTFGGIFNRETNVNLGTGLIVFCVRDLEDELRPIAMFVLLNFIWSRVRSELKKRILVVDEAWTLMQHEDAAKFLFGLVKRARKYYLGVITITQDVEDFLESKYGRPMVTNASMQILLKQAPSAVDALRKTFNLTEGEKYMLLNSGVGQGLFFADSKHVAIQIIASYSENQIVTTNPEELLKQREESFK